MTRAPSTEEPCAAKVSSTVLKTSERGDPLAEFNQDHRGVKRVTRPMSGVKSFEAAQSTLTGIELMHMLRKGVRHEVA
jgi:transposase-like protein